MNALTQQAALALAYANAYESLYELNQTLEERVKIKTEQGMADQKSIAAYEGRQKIARDLHDSVTQSIFGMHIMARGLAAKSTSEMKDDLQALETQARDMLKEMRLMLGQLRNDSTQETVNLTEAVQGLCDSFAQRRGAEGGSLLSITQKMPERVILQKSIADDINKLEYTRMVVKETLRMRPPAWAIGRQAMNDCEIGGQEIKAASGLS